MNKYVVLYRESDDYPGNPPLAFACDADDMEHAEEQCENAYPSCSIAWVCEGRTVDETYSDYWQLTP